ncbi:MAG TPA: nuclear transport factor 2 family protein [Candidatus Sulfotelmatobacter sp.]|jgi:ketosteroid isomerase-like protein|nr:nuclear transport factor 2 family protein [Candidatus Sulfotelmatobacter sp.]
MSYSLTQENARAFADEWISSWNRKDVEAVLSHFSEDAVFTSPRAASVMQSSRLEGKARLREYWTRAMAQIQNIHFTLDYVTTEFNRVGIIYIAEIDGKRMRAVEFLIFGNDGLIHQGEAMHGVTL